MRAPATPDDAQGSTEDPKRSLRGRPADPQGIPEESQVIPYDHIRSSMIKSNKKRHVSDVNMIKRDVGGRFPTWPLGSPQESLQVSLDTLGGRGG